MYTKLYCYSAKTWSLESRRTSLNLGCFVVLALAPQVLRRERIYAMLYTRDLQEVLSCTPLCCRLVVGMSLGIYYVLRCETRLLLLSNGLKTYNHYNPTFIDSIYLEIVVGNVRGSS